VYDPRYTFVDYCTDRDLGSPEVDRTVAALQGILQEKDCQKAFEALKERRSLILSSMELTNIDPLTGLDGLEALVMSDNVIADLRPLATLKNLKVLSLTHAGVKDISVLAELRNLQVALLASNQITDLTPLKDSTALHTLGLAHNPIRDISPLRELSQLKDYNSWDGLWLDQIALGTELAATDSSCPVGAEVSSAVAQFCQNLRAEQQ
ncbi:MAG: leucine-rich repeat domain-containing protein, partial [Pseudobdellovibrionaceae bacterium]|nr:leucine-rich repeat domain-containing protein [Pseudobdellovibrionaceae bacterium]